MRRLLILALAAAGGFFVAQADAAPEPMRVVSERQQLSTVEEYGHIPNDTGCTWDPDDVASIWAQGDLAPTGFTFSTCAIFDYMNDPVLGIDFRAPKARPFTATVQMVNATGTHTITYQSVRDGNTQRVKKCFTGPRYDADVVFPLVGSYGGAGYYTTLTFTMQPIGERTARDSTMIYQLLPDTSTSTPGLCGTYYTIGNPWPYCEGDPFVDGRVCYQ